MKIDHNYIADIVRELFDELHDYLADDFIQGLPQKHRQEALASRERNRPVLGALSQDADLIEDYAPRLFDTYNGDAELKDVIRAFIDALYQYRGIHHTYHLHNELRYEIEPKYNENKSREDRIDTFKQRLKEVFFLMGGDAYFQDVDVQALIREINKAYVDPSKYVKPAKEKKPKLDTSLKQWLMSLKLPNKQKEIEEFMLRLK